MCVHATKKRKELKEGSCNRPMAQLGFSLLFGSLNDTHTDDTLYVEKLVPYRIQQMQILMPVLLLASFSSPFACLSKNA
jgi:hypothetical protein